MDKDEYIKKLERKIHNQRLALRWLWNLIEQYQTNRKTPLKTKWFDKVISLGKEVNRLKGNKS